MTSASLADLSCRRDGNHCCRDRLHCATETPTECCSANDECEADHRKPPIPRSKSASLLASRTTGRELDCFRRKIEVAYMGLNFRGEKHYCDAGTRAIALTPAATPVRCPERSEARGKTVDRRRAAHGLTLLRRAAPGRRRGSADLEVQHRECEKAEDPRTNPHREVPLVGRAPGAPRGGSCVGVL